MEFNRLCKICNESNSIRIHNKCKKILIANKPKKKRAKAKLNEKNIDYIAKRFR